MIDLAALTEAVYQRLKTESAGAAVRALLPGGAAAILLAQDVRDEALTVAELPARPLLALRRGAVPALDRIIWGPQYTWYCYDDPDVGYGRLEQLPALIAAAYATELNVSTVLTECAVAAGPQTQDPRLGLLQVVTVSIEAV